MSESRPLTTTVPPAEATSCPLFSGSAGPEVRSWAVSAWGVGWVALLLVEAIARLGARALSTLREGLSPAQWSLLLLSLIGFGYGEGYRALRRRFSPHVIARAHQLALRHTPGLRSWICAPAYVLCLVQAERKELRRAWLSVALIVGAVLSVRALPEPYRGIVDAGVAVALAIGLWALISRFAMAARAARGKA